MAPMSSAPESITVGSDAFESRRGLRVTRANSTTEETVAMRAATRGHNPEACDVLEMKKKNSPKPAPAETPRKIARRTAPDRAVTGRL